MTLSLLRNLKHPPSVKASLAVLVIACILPVSGVTAILILSFYHKERTQLISNTIGRARAAATAVDHDFGTATTALGALATSRMLLAGDLQGFHSRAVTVLGSLHADSILVLDPTGKMLMSTRRPYGEPLPTLNSAPLLRRILASGKPGVSDLFKGPLNQQLIYTVGVPVWRDGRVVMTLNATATPAQLAHVLVEQQLPPSWRASVLDASGRVVTRSHEMEKYVGQRLSDEQLRHAATASEGGFNTTTLDGIEVFVVFSRAPVSGWTVFLGIPQRELTAGLRANTAWLIGATLAALAAGLALAWLVAGRITRSVQLLIPPALAIGHGQAPAIPPLQFKEAIELGQALRNAAASVREARAASQESEQRLLLAADAAHLGIWIRDLKRQEIWLSDQWRALFGFAAGQPVGLADLLARVHADDRAAVQRTLDNAELGVPRYEMEYRITLPDGAQRWIGSHGSVETDAAGRPALVRGVSLDITARKQAELDALQRQKEVTHLSRVAVLGELSGALAHELNQPLTAILSNAQAARRFLERQPPDLAEVDEILRDIIDEDRRAGEVIQRLRRLFDKGETPRAPVDLNFLTRDVIRLLRNDLINHGIAVRTELTAPHAVASADAVQLQQVLINLLMNACDAMAGAAPDEAVIVVRSAPAGAAAVQLSVIDHGAGIPAAALAHIFEPFYTTKERGMGLGLSICRNIVAAHHGQLWAENNPGGGASVHLRLPLATAAIA
ncbi:PAS domain-containing protein [Duganella sp. FT109W]|uniref:histidine kinase n=1 Tax=Duganella margarita TaxID=2692170 RepID=A0ABW9WKT0_9BURK|nr:PAS domain-containing protein [Duganella margarita]